MSQSAMERMAEDTNSAANAFSFDHLTFEEVRQKNLVDNKEFLKKILADFGDLKTVKKEAPSKTHRERSGPLRRTGRVNGRRPVTRSMSRRSSASPSTFETFEDSDQDVYVVPNPKESRRSQVADFKSVEEVTEDDICNVAISTSHKVYSSEGGSTCHQCRQKTLDTKTFCRSGVCIGVRGAFCGPCLKNRYGEDVAEALKDKGWCCPPCREICNCSICRRRSGKSATGILIHLAREHGHKDCATFLTSLRKKLT